MPTPDTTPPRGSFAPSAGQAQDRPIAPRRPGAGKPGPVLFAGGSGVVGRAALTWFHRRHPDVPTIVGGRNLQRAQEAARETGAAGAIAIDLDRPGIALDDADDVAAIVAFAPDHALSALDFALDRGIPFLSSSTWLTEVGAETALFAHRPTSPIVLAGHWWGGAATFLALRGAEKFDTVHAIRLGAVIDEKEPIGPASIADMKRGADSSAVLAFEHGRREWLTGDAAKGRVQAIDGRVIDAEAYAPADIASLRAATKATDIRFDLAMTTSSSRLAGGPVAAEIVVEIEGVADGEHRASRSTLEFPGGQSLTGLGIVLSLPAVLGLDELTPVPPGIYLPELLSETDWFLRQLVDAGATLRSSP